MEIICSTGSPIFQRALYMTITLFSTYTSLFLRTVTFGTSTKGYSFFTVKYPPKDYFFLVQIEKKPHPCHLIVYKVHHLTWIGVCKSSNFGLGGRGESVILLLALYMSKKIILFFPTPNSGVADLKEKDINRKKKN